METTTIIEFRHGGDLVRSVHANGSFPGLAVGNSMTFDDPMLTKSMHGKVVRISHVVFSSEGAPITYVDVEV